MSDYYVLRGEDATALAEVDALLAEQPTHIVGLTYRAQLLRLGGQLDEALASYAAAVAAYSETSRGTSELPFRLLTEHGELQAEVEARTTYEVEVASKTPLHPYFEQGSTSGFLINGVEGGELWLAEDTTYTFRMVNVPPESPFYFSTNAVGSGAAPYGDGVTGQPASGTEEVTLTPGATTPDLLYYQSTSQPNMGWRIHILRGSASVGADMPPVTLPVEYHLTSSYPNPFRQETRLTLTVARPQRVMVRVFDVRGREVAILFDGDLPAGVPRELVWHGAGLTSGLFIVRVEGVTFSATRLVVLVK